MNIWKALIKAVFCLIFYLSLPVSVFATQNVEIVTYDTLPPYAFRNNAGELTGAYIKIVQQAVSRMPEYDVSFRVLPWARAKLEIENGKAFAILPPYFHAHDWLTQKEPKKPYIWPYSLPLLTQFDVVICNSEVLKKPRKRFPDDYQSLRFVMSKGDGRAGSRFLKLAEDKKVGLSRVASIEQIILFLLAERADCTITSKYPFAWYLNAMKQKNRDQMLNSNSVQLSEAIVISTNEGYLGYTDINASQTYPFKKDFVMKFDIEIYKMKKSGEIKKLIDHFAGSH